MTRGIFVTATGTDAGKTYITALLLKTLRQGGYAAGYYKPALSGAVLSPAGFVPGDADYVCRTAQLEYPPEEYVTQMYKTPVSPHLASMREGHPLSVSQVADHVQRLSRSYDWITVEGSGGIVCPLAPRPDGGHIFLEDLIRLLAIPILIVAPAGLGTINSTVLTVEYAQRRDFTVAGVILNHWQGGYMEQDNLHMIERYTGVPVLAVVPEEATAFPVSAVTLSQWYKEMIFT